MKPIKPDVYLPSKADELLFVEVQVPSDRLKVKFDEKIAKWHKDREMHEIKWKVIGAREVMQKKEYKQKMNIV